MNPLLAELSGLEIAGIIAGFVFGSLGLILSYWLGSKKQQVSVDQPVSVKVIAELDDRFAAKKAFEHHCEQDAAEFRRQRDESKQDRETIDAKNSARIKGVYDRIENVRRELGDKVDDMPDRIIATLKNAGRIH
jgi:hypothetical protein